MSEAYKTEWKEELIDGKIVAMSPAASNHNRVSGNIFGIFWSYLRGKSCVPFGGNELVFLTPNDEFVPDFMIVCDQNKIKNNGVYGAPDLVVEVLSPSTAKYDRTHKKDIYAKCGVHEYWIVSPAEKFIEVYRNNGKHEFYIHDVYTIHSKWALSKMSETERNKVVTHFKCSLYDDLDIYLEDIFYGLT